MQKTPKAKIIRPHDLGRIATPLPKSWSDVVGLLKNKSVKTNALDYQHQVRQEWDKPKA